MQHQFASIPVLAFIFICLNGLLAFSPASFTNTQNFSTQNNVGYSIQIAGSTGEENHIQTQATQEFGVFRSNLRTKQNQPFYGNDFKTQRIERPANKHFCEPETFALIKPGYYPFLSLYHLY